MALGEVIYTVRLHVAILYRQVYFKSLSYMSYG